jgi:hypothetical protein
VRGLFVGLGSKKTSQPETGAAGGIVTFLVSETPKCRSLDRITGVRPFTRELRVATRVRANGRFEVRIPFPLPPGEQRTFNVRARFGGTRLLDAGIVPNSRGTLGIDAARHRLGAFTGAC